MQLDHVSKGKHRSLAMHTHSISATLGLVKAISPNGGFACSGKLLHVPGQVATREAASDPASFQAGIVLSLELKVPVK